MKKYKHKITNDIVEKFEVWYRYTNTSYATYRLPKNIIENSNDWEEIEEYEILHFRHKKDHSILIFNPITRCWDYNKKSAKGLSTLTTEKALIGNWEICSIKRLSDNVMFTIGDKINMSCHQISTGTIKGFDLNNKWKSSIAIIYDGHYNCYIRTNNMGDLSQASLNKQSLFVTEDGVEIFDAGQNIFSVSELDYVIQDHQDYAWISTRSPIRKYHHFSTKEAAEEYVIMHKPQFSLRELLDIHFGKGNFEDRVKSEAIYKVFKSLNNE